LLPGGKGWKMQMALGAGAHCQVKSSGEMPFWLQPIAGWGLL